MDPARKPSAAHSLREIVIKIDDERFAFEDLDEALELLEKAVELARHHAVAPPKITANTRALRSAIRRTRRELNSIWLDRAISQEMQTDIDNEAICLLW